ncbi:MAG TPA: methyltransferase domain-containing protein [Candidatus Dormibacteraeota bacterium]|nr:methyltransferase domain-containing protein [Candidatus Dormibacteraeota bacterium]
MDYATAVGQAPPGWRHFTPSDIGRLPNAVLRRELARVPPQDRSLFDRGDPDATDRVLRALFWTLVYHLEPERWDELARCEPIHPELIAALPDHVAVCLDVGAGSGRLTQHLTGRAQRVIAVEPSLGLASILARRMPSVVVVSGWAESLPLPDHCAQLTAACGAFGPDLEVITELERVTAGGGCIALINPEEPDWFERHGWTRKSVHPLPPTAHPQWLDEFFGPSDPPRELLMRRVPGRY